MPLVLTKEFTENKFLNFENPFLNRRASYEINGTLLQLTTVKDLSTVFDQTLTFSHHINYIPIKFKK